MAVAIVNNVNVVTKRDELVDGCGRFTSKDLNINCDGEFDKAIIGNAPKIR